MKPRLRFTLIIALLVSSILAAQAPVNNKSVTEDISVNQIICTPGRGGNSCTKCYPGFYSLGNFYSRCKPCEPGHYADETGSSKCSSCSPGYYNDKWGQPTCNPCPPGTYSNYYRAKSCNSCSAGHYQPAEGQSRCKSCPVGYYSEYGGSTCQLCEINYCSGRGATSPTQSQVSRYNYLAGSPSSSNGLAGYSFRVKPIPAGFSRSSLHSVLEPCDSNTFCSTGNQVQVCSDPNFTPTPAEYRLTRSFVPLGFAEERHSK